MTTGLREEIGKRGPFYSPEQEAYLNLVRTQSRLATQCERLFRSFGLSAASYNVLRILRGSGGPGVTCSRIGEQLVAQVPDVTRLIDRLEREGLVERTRIPEDRRIVLIRLTRTGADLLARIDRPLMELHDRQLGHMSRAELATLGTLLTKARQGGADLCEEAASSPEASEPHAPMGKQTRRSHVSHRNPSRRGNPKEITE